MNTKDWKELKKLNANVLALPGPWLRVVDFIAPGKIVRCTAAGQWHYLPGHAGQCEPDGFLGLPLPCEQLQVATAPLGALLGKLGGSSADQKDGTVFTIGRFAMTTVPEKTPSALFITVNTLKGARIERLERLELIVEAADP